MTTVAAISEGVLAENESKRRQIEHWGSVDIQVVGNTLDQYHALPS
jgi:hypothetical protein